MLNLPSLTSDEKSLVRVVINNKKEQLRRELRTASDAKIHDAKRSGNTGLAIGLTIDAVITGILNEERAKLDAVEEVLNTVGKKWTIDLVNDVREDISHCLKLAEEKLINNIESGSYGLKPIPQSRRRGTVLGAKESFRVKRNDFVISLALLAARVKSEKQEIMKTPEDKITQNVHISNSPNAIISIAGRDIINENPDYEVFIEKMRLELQDDKSLAQSDKEQALQTVDLLKKELEKAEKNPSKILAYLGYLADISTVALLAHELSQWLISMGILGI